MQQRTPATISLALILALTLAAFGVATAQGATGGTVMVTIENTSPTSISPPVLIAHGSEFALFTLFEPASPELALMAEDGVPDDLAAVARIGSGVTAVVVSDGGVPSGESVTLSIDVGDAAYLTWTGMLTTSNDAFVVWTYPLKGDDMSMMDMGGPAFADGVVRVFDAGTEANTELCEHVPGVPCGNKFVRATEGAEGFVTLHGGILGVGDLDPSVWDWRHPVAVVTVAH